MFLGSGGKGELYSVDTETGKTLHQIKKAHRSVVASFTSAINICIHNSFMIMTIVFLCPLFLLCSGAMYSMHMLSEGVLATGDENGEIKV